MTQIKKHKLYKPEVFLLATGELLYGQEEFIYIKSLNCDNLQQAISGEYLRLLKVDSETFEIIAPVDSGAYFKYSIKNNCPVIDINGVEVYAYDENRNILLDEEGNPVSRLDSYDANISTFGPALAAVMMLSIKSHLGYHPSLGE